MNKDPSVPGAIAVIIPCRNHGETIEETLASVAAQTRPAAEIVVVDDGSDDDQTSAILAKIEKGAVRVLRTKHHGVAHARDVGVRNTSAPYLLWLDADDLLDPHFLEDTGNCLDTHHEAEFVATAFSAFGEETFTWKPPRPEELVRHVAEGSYTISALFRRCLWETVGGCDPQLLSYEDWDFWLRVLKDHHSGIVLEEPLFKYRTSLGSRRYRSYENDTNANAARAVLDKHSDLVLQLGTTLLDLKRNIVQAQRDRYASLIEHLQKLTQQIENMQDAPDPPGSGPAKMPVHLRRAESRAIVLVYHRIADLAPDAFGLCIPRERFREQMHCLTRMYQPVSLSGLIEAMAQDRLPERAVAVTVDDGYGDAFAASEVLCDLGIPVTFFVNSGRIEEVHETWEDILQRVFLDTVDLPPYFRLTINSHQIEVSTHTRRARRAAFDALHHLGRGLTSSGRDELIVKITAWSQLDLSPRQTHRLMTVDEVRELANRKGHDIGSHTAYHLSLPEHGVEIAKEEIFGDKQKLEKLIGRPVRSFAYPYGEATPAILALVRAVGFQSAWTVAQGSAHAWDDSLLLPRNDLGMCNVEEFTQRLDCLLGASGRSPKSVSIRGSRVDSSQQVLDKALHHLPESIRNSLATCLAGEVSLEIGMMWLLGAFPENIAVETLQVILEELKDNGSSDFPIQIARLSSLLKLFQDNAQGCARVAEIYRVASPELLGRASPAKFGEYFDKTVTIDEIASVALYSLGNAKILAAATEEIVELLCGWGVLGKARSAIEIGCGIGRILEALSPHIRAIEGVDVSPKMIAHARKRIAHLPNVSVCLSNGCDLSGHADASCDFVLAVDSWPCVVASGADVVQELFREIWRVLRPGGDFVILNYSYRFDLAKDQQDVRSLSSRIPFDIKIEAQQAFKLWDGIAWWLKRSA